jgi:hypothetical protein
VVPVLMACFVVERRLKPVPWLKWRTDSTDTTPPKLPEPRLIALLEDLDFIQRTTGTIPLLKFLT